MLRCIIDVEVFSKWNGAVIGILPDTDEENAQIVETIIYDCRDCNFNQLKEWLKAFDIVIGYNLAKYDYFILSAMCVGADIDLIYQISNEIIERDLNGWDILKKYGIPTLNINYYDCITDDSLSSNSLKNHEANLGFSIEESKVDFTIQRELTNEEIEDILNYCKHDVLMTYEIFKKVLPYYTSHVDLCKLICKKYPEKYKNFKKLLKFSNTKLAAIYLNAKEVPGIRESEWLQDDILDKCEERMDLSKWQDVVEWYRSRTRYLHKLLQETLISNDWTKYSKELTNSKLIINRYDMEITISMGGIHGCVVGFNEFKNLIDIDVKSMYPNIMRHWDLISRAVDNKEDFSRMIDERVALKEIDPVMASCLKIILNSVYGGMGNRYISLYDPQYSHSVCIVGQLCLLALMSKIAEYVDKFVQINTDGIFIVLNDSSKLDLIKEKVKEWEKETSLEMDYGYFNRMWQSDVNNYLIEDTKGKVKGKGRKYVLTRNCSNVEIPLYQNYACTYAVREYFLNNIEPAETINKLTNAIEFQITTKITSAFEGAIFNGKKIHGNTFRGFAHKNGYKLEKMSKKGVPNKIGGIPEKFCIYNKEVINMKIGDAEWLDKNWYIEEAKRLIGVAKQSHKEAYKAQKFETWKTTYPYWAITVDKVAMSRDLKSKIGYENFEYYSYDECFGENRAILTTDNGNKGIIVLDIDDVDNDTKRDLVKQILDYFKSYSEISVNNNGYHIILLVDKEVYDKLKNYKSTMKWAGLKIEIKSHNKWCNITEKQIDGYDEIKTCSSKMSKILDLYGELKDDDSNRRYQENVENVEKSQCLIEEAKRELIQMNSGRYTRINRLFYALYKNGMTIGKAREISNEMFHISGWTKEHGYKLPNLTIK